MRLHFAHTSAISHSGEKTFSTKHDCFVGTIGYLVFKGQQNAGANTTPTIRACHLRYAAALSLITSHNWTRLKNATAQRQKGKKRCIICKIRKSISNTTFLIIMETHIIHRSFGYLFWLGKILHKRNTVYRV